jgi:peptidyl-prolyl cis-trans isomerase C
VIRIVPFVAVLALTGCSRPPATEESPVASGNAMPAAAAPVVQEATPGPVPAQLPEVVARVNGEPITRAELEMAVGQLEARAGQSVPPEQRDGVFRGVLDELIGFRLLKQESVARAVVVPASAVEARIDEIRSQVPSEAMFIQTIESRGTTLDSLREQAREGMEIDAMLQAVLTATAVTPDQVTAFYNENPAEFQQGERVRASHILIGFPEGASPDIKQQALAKAAELLDEVKAGGDFAALARQHSSDQGSAAAGGDLGYFERGQMVGPFEQAAFALLPAQTSELVESPFGYHIIRVVDRQASRTIPIADVRPQIQQLLEGRDRAQQTEAFVETLKAKGKVEILI